jgi:hypothetical protein
MTWLYANDDWASDHERNPSRVHQDEQLVFDDFAAIGIPA